MKALVVNPWVTDFKLYDEWMHPCGLYFLMSLLSHNGTEVCYYNCLDRTPDLKTNANGTARFASRDYPKPNLYAALRRHYKLYGNPLDDFTHYLLSIPRPDVIFIGSAMTYWIAGVKETADVLARVFPSVPCVVGGIAATLAPHPLKSRLDHAYVFSGSLFDKTSLAASGIPILSAMNNLPRDASMLPGLRFLNKAFHGPALTSFGCPMTCTYCASRTLWNTYRPRPPETVADEVEYIVTRFSVRHVAFYDDALLYKPDEHLLPFLKILRERGVFAHFHVPNGMHVRWITPQILDIMIKSGFSTLRFGYESGSAENARHVAAKTTFEDLERKIPLIRSAGFSAAGIGIYVMAGLPGQTPQDVADEMDSVASLGVMAKPVFLSPVPTTPLFDYYSKLVPEIMTDPLTHNDSYFITRLPGWDAIAVQEIIDRAKKHNAGLANGASAYFKAG
jgi:Radical SAM superfamily